MTLVTPSESARPRPPRCPTCGVAVVWRGNAHRPFCSLSCRLIDLGGWLDERYRIAGEALDRRAAPEDRTPAGSG